MKNNFYLLPLMLLAFSFQSASQNCSTPSLENQSICVPGNYTFQTSSGKLAVYHVTDTSVISIASSVTVNPTVSTHYLYAQTDQVGPVDHTIGAGDFYTTVDKYVSFNADHDVIINSIDVYPQNAGEITIRFVKMGGFLGMSETLIESRTVTVSSGGFQTVDVDFYVPQGSGYRLVLTSETCGGLFRNSAGQTFPYTSPSGSVEITGGDYSFMGYYYYFYNWNITPIACINTMELSVGTAPSAAVSTVANTLQADEPGLNYQWVDCASDQPVSGAVGQQFSPSESGNYAVIVSNGGCAATSDCVSFMVNTASLLTKLDNAALYIYPNPVADRLFIQTDEKVDGVRITDFKGRLMADELDPEFVDVSRFPAGIYFVEITAVSGNKVLSKVIKK